MLPKQLTIKTIIDLPFVILVCSALTFFSCNGNKEKTTDLEMPAAKITGIDGTCTELTKSAIEAEWVTPGHIKSISYVDFFTSYDWLTGAFSVRAQAYDVSNNRLGNPITLSKGGNCAVKLPSLSIGENIINMTDLDILDAKGDLKNFSKLVLTPRKFVPPTPGASGDYLQYDISVVSEEGPAIYKYTLPCPPCQYCKPPNCDTVIIDSPLITPESNSDTTGN